MRLLRLPAGRLRLWTILVLALFAFDALAPALAALAGARPKAHFTQVCTIDGATRIVPLEDPATAPGSNEFAFQCPLCTGSSGPAAIDAPRVPCSLIGHLRHERPAADAPVSTRSDLRAPLARGPPSLA